MSKTEKVIITICMIPVLTLILLLAFELQMYTIAGHSMFPTMVHGDTCVTTNKFFFGSLEYKRYDVIMFREEFGTDHVVKRIIGLPGEHIQIKDNMIFINEKAQRHMAILISKMDEARDRILGPDEYYVLGDNRPYSHDSRVYGPIKQWQIRGRVWLRWRPLTGL